MCEVLDRVEARGMEKGIEENRIATLVPDPNVVNLSLQSLI